MSNLAAPLPAIERTLELAASVERVWQAITDEREIAGWFGDTAELAPEVGSEGWFGWENHGRYAVQVTVFDPPHRLAWRWARDPDRGLHETHTTLVEWTLTATPNRGTRLELRESGFLAPADREDNSGGWTAELGHLEAFLDR